MPINLDYPGLNVLHHDPPIFTIDEFLSREECQSIIQAAAGHFCVHFGASQQPWALAQYVHM